MKLLDFLNTHENWEELLSREPYALKIKKSGDYILFMYNQYRSDFSLPEVCEARGSIFYWNGREYECVCHPFDKFFNHTEPHASKIDWDSARVLEKIDGSLIKLWHHNREWHLSTNGMIDAFSAMVTPSVNFGVLFEYALTESILGESVQKVIDFFSTLDSNYTYMFELVSPMNRIIVSYNAINLYYLGRRNIKTDIEDTEFNEVWSRDFGILQPRCYLLETYRDCITTAHLMTAQEEGYVVVDKNYNRIKIKSKGYLEAAQLRVNNLTIAGAIRILKEGRLDDFYSCASQEQIELMKRVLRVLHLISSIWEADLVEVANIRDRKELALKIKNWESKGYIFYSRDNACQSAFDYLINNCHAEKVAEIIERKMLDARWELLEGLFGNIR